MTLKEVLKQLESLGDEKRRKHNAKNGPDGTPGVPAEKQFGVPMGDIRVLAKKIKIDHALALELWDTGNIDAQCLAILIMDPKQLSAKELDGMARSGKFGQVADWLASYIVKDHPDAEALRIKWMSTKDSWAARHGWALTAARINKGTKDLNLSALLDRIEKEMPKAKPQTQWTMNNTLAAIGINDAKLRKRALAIGEKIGLYKDWPMSKGCVIPYIPVWVNEMVKRKG